MTLCLKCKWADWNKTENGRLHPNGGGQCRYTWTPPPLPACMYFFSPCKPSGGFINRKQSDFQSCPTFEALS